MKLTCPHKSPAVRSVNLHQPATSSLPQLSIHLFYNLAHRGKLPLGSLAQLNSTYLLVPVRRRVKVGASTFRPYPRACGCPVRLNTALPWLSRSPSLLTHVCRLNNPPTSTQRQRQLPSIPF